MPDLTELEADILRRYSKAVVHLRKQNQLKRLGLVFGAGIGRDVGLPGWDELVDRIAAHPEVLGQNALQNAAGMDQSLTLKIQRLYEWFRNKPDLPAETMSLDPRHKDRKIIAEWRRIVRDCLYSSVFNYDSYGIKNKHPYMGNFRETIRRCDVVINYNFDELIQLLLWEDQSGAANYRRLFRTISKGALRSRADIPIIYHPNGFLPRNLLESTDQLVFSEESFADQFLQIAQHKEAYLDTYLANRTCLFVGLSLNDPNLKHILRNNSNANPGQCHYYIFYDEGKLCNEAKSALSLANFQVYNLITLYMNKEEIGAFASLISKEGLELKRGAEQAGIELRYFYYVTGPMGVGKSTCLSHLYSLTAFEEWTQERLQELARDRNTLDAAEVDKVNRWLDDEFYRKNWNLSNAEEGLHIVDRPPLDPLSFTNRSQWQERAQALRRSIISASQRKVQSGHVFLLIGDAWELYSRIISQNKTSGEATIRQIQAFLQEIYRIDGITVIDTRSMSISELVRRVAYHIHLCEYIEANLHNRLEEIADRQPVQVEFDFIAIDSGGVQK